MTVSITSTSETYTGNGATTTFAIPFPFLANSHIVVTLILISDGTETAQVSGTDYNISGTNVVMTTAPSSLYYLKISRATPKTQSTNFDVGQTYITEDVEDAVDKLTYIMQEIYEEMIDAEAIDTTIAHETAQSFNAGGIVAISENGRQFIEVSGAAGAITLNATTPIEDGTQDMQELFLMGVHATNTVTIPDSGNVDLNGACVLGLSDSIYLIWHEDDGVWYEMSRRA